MEIKEDIDITILVAIASAGIVFLIMFLIIFLLFHQRKMLSKDAKIIEKENNFNKALLNATLEIAEEERGKIARNVHDDLGMMLHTLKINISKAKRNLTSPEVVSDSLEQSDKIIEETIDTIRAIAGDLLPGPLTNIGFIAGLNYLCDQINSNNIIKIQIISDSEEVSLEKKNAVHLYRLIKEVLNNIIKHATASEVKINVTSSTSILNIIVGHNGEGITNENIKRLSESSKGIGLRSIMGRAQLIGATVQYVVIDHNNAKIIIETPLL